MHNFTPITSLIGGIMIGVSASAMLLLEGKIAGISGIFAGALNPAKGELLWKSSFVAGLLAGGVVLRMGAPLFGAGWGLGGFCPGPAITSLASGSSPVTVFVAAMAAGIYLHSWLAKGGVARSRTAPTLVQAATNVAAQIAREKTTLPLLEDFVVLIFLMAVNADLAAARRIPATGTRRANANESD
jgi:uncharacterized membrane protein YedE/YeeE